LASPKRKNKWLLDSKLTTGEARGAARRRATAHNEDPPGSAGRNTTSLEDPIQLQFDNSIKMKKM
jgi:hypothetical protein